MDRLTLIGTPLLAKWPLTCRLFACRTEACMDVMRAVEVGSAGCPLAVVLAGPIIDLPLPQPATMIPAQAATPTAAALAAVPMIGLYPVRSTTNSHKASNADRAATLGKPKICA